VADCRHTFATWAIAAGVQLFYLSRITGTSITQIDATYGHPVPDSEEYLRGLLDEYDVATTSLRERRSRRRGISSGAAPPRVVDQG
jgi:hypothetical protein